MSFLAQYQNAVKERAEQNVPEVIKCVAFKVAGETNTDDLSPTSDAFTRSDIPLHTQAMLKNRQAGSLEKSPSLKKAGAKWLT